MTTGLIPREIPMPTIGIRVSTETLQPDSNVRLEGVLTTSAIMPFYTDFPYGV